MGQRQPPPPPHTHYTVAPMRKFYIDNSTLHEQHNKQGVNASSVSVGELTMRSKFGINQELCQTLNHIYKSNLERVKFLQAEAGGAATK